MARGEPRPSCTLTPFDRSPGRGTSFHLTYLGWGWGWGGSDHCRLSLVSCNNHVGRWVHTWFLSHIAPLKARLLRPSNCCSRSCYSLGSPRWKQTQGARVPWVPRKWRPAPCPSLAGPVWCSLRTESPGPASGREVWARWPGDSLGEYFLCGHSRPAKGSRERFPGLSATTAILGQAFRLQGARWHDLP